MKGIPATRSWHLTILNLWKTPGNGGAYIAEGDPMLDCFPQRIDIVTANPHIDIGEIRSGRLLAGTTNAVIATDMTPQPSCESILARRQEFEKPYQRFSKGQTNSNLFDFLGGSVKSNREPSWFHTVLKTAEPTL